MQRLLRYVAEVVRPAWLAQEYSFKTVIVIAAWGSPTDADVQKIPGICGQLDQTAPLIVRRQKVSDDTSILIAALYLSGHIAYPGFGVIDSGPGQDWRHMKWIKAFVSGGVRQALTLAAKAKIGVGQYVRVEAVQPRAVLLSTNSSYGDAGDEGAHAAAAHSMLSLCLSNTARVTDTTIHPETLSVSAVVEFDTQAAARFFMLQFAADRQRSGGERDILRNDSDSDDDEPLANRINKEGVGGRCRKSRAMGRRQPRINRRTFWSLFTFLHPR